MRLAVELYGTVVGTLEGDRRTFDFTATAAGLERFGLASQVLSASVPLVLRAPRHRAARRRNWFTELLPEGDQLDHMRAKAGLRNGDTPAFLARYGRDVAGALQIWDLDDPTEPQEPTLRILDEAQVRGLLTDPIGSPLANAPEGGKSSLAGVQPKIVLTWQPSGWAQALGGYPTTHILKPQLEGARRSVIYDEEYGARLARAVGLAEFNARVQVFDGLPALVIERYDRRDGQRVHQEDFNQVLGASGNEKYQEYGGVVSFARIARELDRAGLSGELVRLARMVTFAVAIGNLDLHAKNLSMLHPVDRDASLAPAYDVVPQTHLPGSDGRLAMSVNGVYRHRAVTRADIADEVRSWGLRSAGEVVERSLVDVRRAATDEEPLEGAHRGVQDDVLRIVENLLSQRGAGER